MKDETFSWDEGCKVLLIDKDESFKELVLKKEEIKSVNLKKDW